MNLVDLHIMIPKEDKERLKKESIRCKMSMGEYIMKRVKKTKLYVNDYEKFYLETKKVVNLLNEINSKVDNDSSVKREFDETRDILRLIYTLLYKETSCH